jgi:Domain of unknown function (DUF4295)
MAKKVSKNSKAAQRATNAGSGKDFIKVIRSVKNETTGFYSYKESMVHKDKIKDFLESK